MSAPNSNILALFHDGHYLADIAGGIRAAHQDGRKADFVNGSSEAEKLQAAYLHDDMTELRQKVVDALQSRGAPDGGAPLKDGDKDWDSGCQVCGQKPTVHPTQLCGPCCFGEAETAGGNW